MAIFLQDNPIESVLELEEEPAEFTLYKFKLDEYIEVDKSMPYDELFRLESELRLAPGTQSTIKILRSVKYKLRWIMHRGVTFHSVIADGSGRTRETHESGSITSRNMFRETLPLKQEFRYRYDGSSEVKVEFYIDDECLISFSSLMKYAID